MSDATPQHPDSDPYDLDRFVAAQRGIYETALAELRRGQKQSHWMWYIFPQFAGLGQSATSKHYAIKSLAEAQAYLRHPVLGPRLVECAEALLKLPGRSAGEVLGSIDAMKLKSCATLFSRASPSTPVFEALLKTYFQGERDRETLRLLGHTPEAK